MKRCKDCKHNYINLPWMMRMCELDSKFIISQEYNKCLVYSPKLHIRLFNWIRRKK